MSSPNRGIIDAIGREPFIGMIWAQTENGVIGKDGGMPWRLPEDMEHFKRTTLGHPVIMGRHTWQSFPAKYRPLPDRTNIVVSKHGLETAELAGAVVVDSLEDAFEEARRSPGAEQIWVIGGGQIYEAALPVAQAAVVTVIESTTKGDTFAPTLGPDWQLDGVTPQQGWLSGANGTRYRISLWTKGRD